MTTRFTDNGRKALLWAQEEAMRTGRTLVEPEHLLLGLLHSEDSGAVRMLDRAGKAASEVRAALAGALPAGTQTPAPAAASQISPATKTVLTSAEAEAQRHHDDLVSTKHLLIALLRSENNPAALTLRAVGLSDQDDAYERVRADEERQAASAAPKASPRGRVMARPSFLKGRHLISITDLSTDEVVRLFELTREIKSGRIPQNGQDKTLAMLFEKPSLRTRVTFQVAMTRLGGNTVYLSPTEIGLGTREPAGDIARCLARWVNAIAARTFAHGTVVDLAEGAGEVPVINALTDHEHPCQALADFYTILEHRGGTTAGQKIAFIGDGNNVSHSLLLLAPRLGAHFAIACPPGYEPHHVVREQAQALAEKHGTQIAFTNDAYEAACDADVLYTDVWASMGQEDERDRRAHDFSAFQINAALVREAKHDALVLHCLPAHRGQEITSEILDGPNSHVYDQAENRLYVQMALLAAVL